MLPVLIHFFIEFPAKPLKIEGKPSSFHKDTPATSTPGCLQVPIPDVVQGMELQPEAGRFQRLSRGADPDFGRVGQGNNLETS